MPSIALPLLAALAMGGQTPATRGTLESSRLIKDYPAPYLQIALKYVHVPTHVKVGVKLYTMRYWTVDPKGAPYLASGAVAIPHVPVEASLLSYQHGTVTKKTDVPSYGNDEALLVSAVYAASGNYVVSMPDYLGLGTGEGLHPYLHAQTEASASLDAMRAARALVAKLKVPLRNDVYLAGYSQGGHSTLALAKTIQEENADEFKVAAVAGMSGPYDLAETELPFALRSFSPATPAFMAFLVLAYQSVYGNVYSNPSEAFKPPYDTQVEALFDGRREILDLIPLLPKDGFRLFTKRFIGPLLLPPYSAFYEDLQKNALWDWKPTMPMRLYAAQSDEIVSYGNSVKASQAMNAKGADVPLISLGSNQTHLSAIFKALPASRTWFDRVGGYPVKKVR